MPCLSLPTTQLHGFANAVTLWLQCIQQAAVNTYHECTQQAVTLRHVVGSNCQHGRTGLPHLCHRRHQRTAQPQCLLGSCLWHAANAGGAGVLSMCSLDHRSQPQTCGCSSAHQHQMMTCHAWPSCKVRLSLVYGAHARHESSRSAVTWCHVLRGAPLPLHKPSRLHNNPWQAKP